MLVVIVVIVIVVVTIVIVIAIVGTFAKNNCDFVNFAFNYPSQPLIDHA